jgi:hypothetical protein
MHGGESDVGTDCLALVFHPAYRDPATMHDPNGPGDRQTLIPGGWRSHKGLVHSFRPRGDGNSSCRQLTG